MLECAEGLRFSTMEIVAAEWVPGGREPDSEGTFAAELAAVERRAVHAGGNQQVSGAQRAAAMERLLRTSSDTRWTWILWSGVRDSNPC